MTAALVVAAVVLVVFGSVLGAVAYIGCQWRRLAARVVVGDVTVPAVPLMAIRVTRSGECDYIAIEDDEDALIWLRTYGPMLAWQDWGPTTVERCAWPMPAAEHTLALRHRMGAYRSRPLDGAA
jgi:hypothetical protein